MSSPGPVSPVAPTVKRKVLIAVDNSGWAEAAFDWYVKTVHRPDNEVICFHSTEPPWLATGETVGLTAEAYALPVTNNGSDELSKNVTEKFTQKLTENNVSGRIVLKIAARPGEAIVDMAKAEGATMVVMGTRGLGTIRRTILGSVSDYVLHHAHCPVVVCSHNSHHVHNIATIQQHRPSA